MTTNNNSNDILANVIMYIFNQYKVTPLDIEANFKLNNETASSILGAMEEAGIIGPEENGVYPVVVNSIEDVDDGVVEFLNEQNYTTEMIVEVFKKLTTNEKIELSLILKENRNWRDSDKDKPDIDVPVAIRIVDRNLPFKESRSEVLYVEDIKIATWDGNSWSILPPYPKFDYSPLSKYGELKEGTVVTNWGDIIAGELDAWKHRFSRFNDYKLKIEVDPEHEEDVYRALMWGAAYISRFTDINDEENNSDLVNIYRTLCDMQASMDNSSTEVR